MDIYTYKKIGTVYRLFKNGEKFVKAKNKKCAIEAVNALNDISKKEFKAKFERLTDEMFAMIEPKGLKKRQ